MIFKRISLFFFLTFFFVINDSFSKGIIIADDVKVVNLFNDSDSLNIARFANHIANQYDRVILHLGRDYSFERGGMFFSNRSKQNLRIFSKVLMDRKCMLFLWFLDSYGAQQFEKIYTYYKNVIDYQKEKLEEFNILFQGVILDLEWINLPDADNNAKLYEILYYLKLVFDKKITGLFAPLIDNLEESKLRGYELDSIKKLVDLPIAMLYPKDAGLYVDSKNIRPCLPDIRFKALKRFFKTYHIPVAVSLESGLFLLRNEKFYFIKTTCTIPENITSSLNLIYEFKQTVLTIRVYQPKVNISITRNDGVIETVLPAERLVFLYIPPSIVQPEDYIWEYFLMCNSRY